MSEYDNMKAQKEEILSRELQVVCSACGGTCIYKLEKNRVVFTHHCTPQNVRERIMKLRKVAWPWMPARKGQITFEEWSDLVRWVTDTEPEIAEANL
jgi:hypothetical protein